MKKIVLKRNFVLIFIAVVIIIFAFLYVLFYKSNITWKKYESKEYAFEIKYPSYNNLPYGTRSELNILPQSASPSGFFATLDATIPELLVSSENKTLADITISVSKQISPDFWKYYKRLVNLNCPSAGEIIGNQPIFQKINDTSDIIRINGIEFNHYSSLRRRQPLQFFNGNINQINDLYIALHSNLCYTVETSVIWSDLNLLRKLSQKNPPTKDEINKELQAMEKQKKLNYRIVSTFKFLK